MGSHTTDIQQGDKFTFRGLTVRPEVQAQIDAEAAADGEDYIEPVRTITIFDISVDGSLCFRIDLEGSPRQSLASTPYANALLLISQGIWEPAT